MNLTAAIEAYRSAKAKEIYPPKDSFNNFLAFAAGLGEQGSGSYPARTQDPPSDIIAAFEIYEDAKLMNASLSEASYSGLIRCCAINMRKEDGVRLLEEMLALPLTPRNRTYSALLNAFCTSGDKEMSLKLMRELTEQHHLPLLERDYLSLLQLALQHNDSPLFYSMLHTMMEEILVPSSPALWELLTQWFALAPRNGKYSVLRSKVASEEGRLERCNYTLQSLELTDDNKLKLLSEIEKSILGDAADGREGSGSASSSSVPGMTSGAGVEPPKTKRRVNKVMASRERWNEFQSWLTELQEEISDYALRSSTPGKGRYVLIDGANVGFYQQNYANAPNHVNYLQIQAMVTHLQARNMIPIVILHCRHIAPETVPPACSELVNHWKRTVKAHEKSEATANPSVAASTASAAAAARFYFTPAGYNDDIFWLFATVRLDVHVVTNDEMRDHHFQMLSPRWFIRWKDRHQIHFSFGKLLHGSGAGTSADGEEEKEEAHPASRLSMREVSVVFPLTYSHRMQVLLPTRDPTAINRGLFGTAHLSHEQEEEKEAEGAGYFIPLVDQDEWLCIVPNDLAL
jgi:hypothetical protein